MNRLIGLCLLTLVFGMASLSFAAEHKSAANCHITSELICTPLGKASWSKPGFTEDTPILMDAQRVYLSKNTQSYAFDLLSGDLIWSARAPQNAHYFYPSLDQNTANQDAIYLARSDGAIEKRDRKTGKIIWERKLADGWVYPPIIINDQIITAGQDRTLWQINAQSGKVSKQFALAQELTAPLFKVDQLIIASTFDSQLNAYQIGNESPIWRITLPAPGFAFEANQNSLIVSSMDGSLTAINPQTGARQWQQTLHQNAQFWNLLDKNNLYSLNASGAFSQLDAGSGKRLHTEQLSGHFDRAPNLQGEQLALYNTSNLNLSLGLYSIQSKP